MNGIGRDRTVREFIGFVWFNDDWWGTKEGVLVEARDIVQANELIREVFGPTVGVSIWNEEDAVRPRYSGSMSLGGGVSPRVIS